MSRLRISLTNIFMQTQGCSSMENSCPATLVSPPRRSPTSTSPLNMGSTQRFSKNSPTITHSTNMPAPAAIFFFLLIRRICGARIQINTMGR